MATHHSFRRVAFILLLMSQTAQLGLAQEGTGADAPAARYRAFDSDGKQVTIQEVVEAFGGADVVLVGEEHDDPTAHLLEAELLRRAHERHGLGAGAKGRPVALSLEMFERDVQLVVDEYLAGLISERHFLASSRPWKNYQVDYRPLVEYARAQKLPVIAANAPAPPQNPGAPAASPHAPANPHGALHLLDAQNLRDAAMAFAITEHLRRRQDALVLHFNGKFHSEERLGVPEHIKLNRAKTRLLVVTILSGEGFPAFDAAKLGRFGDFVIITDPSLPRSR